MLTLIRSLERYKDLLFMLSWRDIKVKYKQSVMGFLWAILMPVLITTAGVVVKAGLATVSHRPVSTEEILSVVIKSVPWAFFVSSVRFSTQSLSSNYNLVTKIAFPRAIFPLSSVISQLFDLSIATTATLAVCIVLRIGVSWYLFWVPLLLLLLVIHVVGLALFLSAANLFFRDVKYLVEVVLTFAIFFTPVFYDVELFGSWGNLLMLNPIAPLLVGLSDCIAWHRSPPLGWIAYSAAVGVFVAWAAGAIFQQLEPKFAEGI
jgi:ABC-type polysaccharide/polyol phosphate export permease